MNQKIVSIDQLQGLLARWRLKSNKIVFTNGCFDILHIGHLHTLRSAKELGNKLIVGLNSDQSVSRLKGPSRPINKESDRLEMLAALEMVDAVVLFEEDTPLNLIKSIEPDCLVKGGDWKLDQIVGGSEVQQLGGEVCSIPFLTGFSSTGIINKIKSS